MAPTGKTESLLFGSKHLKGIPNPAWTFHSGPTVAFRSAKPEDLLARIAAMIQNKFQKLALLAGTVTAQQSPYASRGRDKLLC